MLCTLGVYICNISYIASSPTVLSTVACNIIQCVSITCRYTYSGIFDLCCYQFAGETW